MQDGLSKNSRSPDKGVLCPFGLRERITGNPTPEKALKKLLACADLSIVMNYLWLISGSLLLMKDVAPFVCVWCGSLTITEVAISFYSFFSMSKMYCSPTQKQAAPASTFAKPDPAGLPGARCTVFSAISG